MPPYVATDITSPICSSAPPPRPDGTDFPFAQTPFCSCKRVLYMSVLVTGVCIGCWKYSFTLVDGSSAMFLVVLW